MDWETDIFSGFPGWNPMSFVNLSGTCATTKLIQCRGMGISTCEVSRKFGQDPDTIVDLQKPDFIARKKVVDAVNRWCDENEGKPEVIYRNEWAPILYDYEIVKSSAKRLRDRGHLIFTDMTLTRFLLVMCFGPSHSLCGSGLSFEEDYAAITRDNANRFMSLLKYIHHDEGKPNFVRATYTTLSRGLHPDFLTSFNQPKNGVPIFHVTAENFVPSLTPGEVERIDNMLGRSSWSKPPPPEQKKLVIGSKQDRPTINNFAWANQKDSVVCGNCGKSGQKSMPTCSGCKLVRYCDRECQRTAWPAHKKACKQAAQQRKASR